MSTREAGTRAPFEHVEDVGAFIREHMTGSSFMCLHDGIRASSMSHGAWRGYVAKRVDEDVEWLYSLDGTISSRELS